MAVKKTSGKKSPGKDKKSKGGIVKGKSHKKGGEKFVVKSTGDKVELEGGEGVLTKESMEIKEEVVLEGTPKEIASQINQMGGGVPFEEECHVCSKNVYSEGGMIDKDGYIHRIGDLVHEEIGKNPYVKSVNINPIKNEISILFYEIVTIDQISELVEESVSFGKQTIFVGSGNQLRAYNFGSEWEEPEFDFKNLSVLYRLKKDQSYESGGMIPARVDNSDTLIGPEQMNLFVPVSETITLEDFIRSNGIELELERHQFGIGTMLTSSSGTRYKVSAIRHFPGNKDSQVILRSQKAFQEEQEYTVSCTFVTILEKFKDGSIYIDGFTSSEIRELSRVLFIIQQTFKTSFLRGENNSLVSMIEAKEKIEQDSILESQKEDEADRLRQSQSEKDEAEQNFDDK